MHVSGIISARRDPDEVLLVTVILLPEMTIMEFGIRVVVLFHDKCRRDENGVVLTCDVRLHGDMGYACGGLLPRWTSPRVQAGSCSKWRSISERTLCALLLWKLRRD